MSDFVTDFNSRVAGFTSGSYGDRYASNVDPVEQAREDAKWQYQEAQLARADAQGRRSEELVRQHDQTMSQARSEVDAGSGAGSAAYNYVNRIAEARGLVAAGDPDSMDRAYGILQQMRADADTYKADFVKYTTMKPENGFEDAIVTGGLYMRGQRFWEESVKLPDGTDTTFRSIFENDKAYSQYSIRKLIQSDFTENFANTYAGLLNGVNDPLKKRTFERLAGQLNDYRRLHNNAQELPDKAGYIDLGDDLATHWDDYVGVLGERGMKRAIDTVMNCVSSGSAIEMMNSIVNWVRAKAPSDPVSGDRYNDVRDISNQFERMCNSSELGRTDKGKRLYSKVMSSLLSGPDAASINFNDYGVRDRMESLTGLYATCEAMRIPLTSLAAESSATDVRGSFRNYILGDNPEDNLFTRVESTLNLVSNLIPSGTKVDVKTGKVDFGDDRFVNSMTYELQSLLARRGMGQLVNGVREDIGLSGLISGGTLVPDMSKVFRATGGFSKDTADYLALRLNSALARSAGGSTPVDFNRDVLSAGFDSSAPEGVKKKLTNWLNGTSKLGAMMPDVMDIYMDAVTSDSIGPGLKGQEAVGSWARVVSTCSELARQGGDPRIHALAAASTFPVYKPTGKYTIPGVPYPVDGETFVKAQQKVLGRNGTYTLQKDGFENIEISKAMVLAALQQVERTAPQNLSAIETPLFGVDGKVILAPGQWTNREARMNFLNEQSILKKMFLENRKADIETRKNWEKEAFKEEGDKD